MIKQRKIAKYVLLQIVTLGIYGLFFWSDWTEDLNKMCEDDDKDSANYILVFLLDIFSFGVYSFVWNYGQSERMYRIAPKYGIQLKHGGSYILLLRTILFFLPVVGSVEKIKLFNTLAVAYNASLTEEEILAAEAQAEAQKQKKSRKEIKAEKKQAKKDAKANKKTAKKEKKSNKALAVEDTIIPTEAGVLPGITDDKLPDITTIEAPVEIAEEVAEEIIEVVEDTPAESFTAPVFETVDPVAYEPVKEDVVETPTFEEPVFEKIVVEEPVFEAPVVEEVIETPVEKEPEIEFTEPVYEIADVEIPDITFAEDVTYTEPVEEVNFTEPAAYEISTEIADVTFIDDENLVPPAKEDVLKQAAKTVGTKRTVKEKVAEEVTENEPVAKKSTKTASDKATKSTKEKKETAKKATKSTADKATKSTAKKETKPKTTKAKKEVEKIEVEEVKVEDLTFGEITFEEVDLGADILSEIEEISKSKK